MGPRSYERGNRRQYTFQRYFFLPLQWGRVLMNAEIVSKINGAIDDLKLQWGRVLMNAEIELAPGLHWCGEMLQWGRVLMNAEISVEAR